MQSFFARKNLFYGTKILLMVLFSLSFYLLSFLLNTNYKTNYLYFDSINSSIENVFKESYDIFIPIKRQLDLFERNLINCTTIGEFHYMKLPNISDIKTPKLENLIMNIMDDTDFKKETLDNFNLLFNQDICSDKSYNQQYINYCKNFWSGILLKGMRQAIIQMGASIGNVLDELESINDIKSNRTLFSLMNDSSFFQYQIFMESYLFRIYNKVIFIFINLREEKLTKIFTIMKYILIIYIFILLILSIFFKIFICRYEYLFISFLNFIGIIPEKYISEDDEICKTIINYGNNLFI